MRILFSSITLFVILSLFISCDKLPPKCPNIEYDGNLTTLNREPYSGTCTTYFKTGELNSIQRYKLGKDHGKWIFFYKNGNLETEGNFNMGKRIGVWKYFYENGEIHKKNTYSSSGKPISVWVTFDEEGNIINKIQK